MKTRSSNKARLMHTGTHRDPDNLCKVHNDLYKIGFWGLREKQINASLPNPEAISN